MTDEEWAAGTFSGLRAAQQQTVARMSARQRLEWLAAAIELAAATGALDRAFAVKQRAIDDAWRPA